MLASVLIGSVVEVFGEGDFGTKHSFQIFSHPAGEPLPIIGLWKGGGEGSILVLWPAIILCYIGPGPGLVVQGPFLLIVTGVLVALFSLLTFPLRRLWRRPKPRGPSALKRLVVIGLDGLEPTRVEHLIGLGKLPHFARLQSEGCYRRLGTTVPPLSPVAWSTFSTGVNPGKHGIFDFVRRGSAYSLELSCSTVSKVPARLGPWRLPWTIHSPLYRRKSKSFWRVLGEHGVPVQVLRVPVTWPPERFNGALLSATGAPDLMGTQGTYTLFSAKEEDDPEHGRRQLLSRSGQQWTALLPGPNGVSLKLFFTDSALRVHGKTHPLSTREFTPWVPLYFGSVQGYAKFLDLGGGEYYMTPLQISPTRPSAPLSHPANLVVSLGMLLGPFATCGMAEDLGARDDGVLSSDAFRLQVTEIHTERERQFFHALKRTPQGVCCAVFDGTDRLQHMTCDPEDLCDLYTRMDDLLARTMQELGPEDGLIVLSDHGFKPLKFLVDVNAWLQQEGYLVAAAEGIDWSRTRAYTLGLTGISLNLKGREGQGIVDGNQARELGAEIAQKLSSLEWEEQQVFARVSPRDTCFQGPYLELAPDLILCFTEGFGLSKEAARGRVGTEVVAANQGRWVADHGYAPEQVPGVLFSSLPLADGPRLEDLAPTILTLFGVPLPGYLDGRNLWQRATETV